MSEEQQLRTVKKMINAGMYDEARAALMSIHHPLADKWLEKLDQIAPPSYQMADRNSEAIRKSRSTSKRQAKAKVQSKTKAPASYDDLDDENTSTTSILTIIVVMIGIGALLIGGAFMLTQSGFVEPTITTDNTNCGAQDWVNSIDGSFNELYRYNLWDMLKANEQTLILEVDENLRNQQMQDLRSRLASVQNSIAPDCAKDSREKIIEAYETQIRATEIFQTSAPINAFGLFGKTLRLMQESARELIDLGAQFRRIDSEAINKVLDEDCPAFAYVTRIMYVDNQFLVMAFVDPQIQTLDAYYSFINDFSQQYYRVLDDPNVKPCLWEVRNQLVETIDGMRSMFEAALGNDLNGMIHHAKRVDVAWDQLMVEIEKVGLDPAQFGYPYKLIILDDE